MPVRGRGAAALGALALGACAGGAGKGPAPADDTGAGAAAPVWPDGGCGRAHTLLPTAGMGEVLAAERDDALSLSAATINALLGAQGLSGLLTATHDVETWRVRYRTQDRGAAVEATGLVVLPAGAGAVPLLLWLHPTVGFSDACAPSALGLEGAAFPILFASTGMAVAAPDYLGMAGFGAPSGRLHPYIVAEPTAVASLDAARALLRLQDGPAAGLGTTADPQRLIHWGASQGGHAALWTDRAQVLYAPELRTVAALASVAPTDLLGLAAEGVASLRPTTAALAGVLVGMDDWYGAGALAEVLQPGPAAALPAEVGASCSDFPTLEAITAVDELFTAAAVDAAARRDWSALPDWGCRLAESSLVGNAVARGHDAPVFIGTAEQDDLVVTAPTRADVPRLCAEGYEITYQECAGEGHTGGAVAGLPTQWAWLQARLAGAPLPAGVCAVGPPEVCPGVPGG